MIGETESDLHSNCDCHNFSVLEVTGEDAVAILWRAIRRRDALIREGANPFIRLRDTEKTVAVGV
jgi:hypothetical protein